MKLSLCMIAKDEEWSLAGCLGSVKGLVDEIILVDTGSIDATMDIARRYGAQVYERPWDGDFSAPRNLAASKATGDWLLILDADERLNEAGGKLIRYSIENPGPNTQFTLKLWDATHTTDTWEQVVGGPMSRCPAAVPILRLFKKGVVWKGRIHECPDLAGPGMLILADIVHYGNCDDGPKQAQKRQRNIDLLKSALEDEPKDVFSAGYLGSEYLMKYQAELNLAEREKRLPDKAWFLAAADVVQSAVPHCGKGDGSFRILAIWGLIACEMGDPGECMDAGTKGEELCPGHPDWPFFKGTAHYVLMLRSWGHDRDLERKLARAEFGACVARLKRLHAGVLYMANFKNCAEMVRRLDADEAKHNKGRITA